METDRLTRREFFTAAGIAAGGAVLAACGSAPSEEVPTVPSTELPKPTSTLRPTETPKPSPTATEVPYQLEDGTQMERVEQGQLVDLFPRSEIFTSERGDIVIIDRETGVELAGQTVEAEYGSLAILVSKTYYQSAVRKVFGKETPFGGYLDLSDLTPKDEVVRIFLTLAGLAHRETSLGSHLSSYIPQKKNLTLVQGAPGEALWFSMMLPEGIYNPDRSHRWFDGIASPIFRISNNNYIQTKAVSAATTPPEWANAEFVENWFLEDLRGRLIFGAMDKMVSAIPGARIEEYHFGSQLGSLFSHPEIYKAIGGALRGLQPPYPQDVYQEHEEARKLGLKKVIEVDFDKFRNTP